MTEAAVKVSLGFASHQRRKAAELFEEAFGGKFGVAIPGKELRLNLFEKLLNGEFALCAKVDDELVGLVGFQTKKGSLTDGFTLFSIVKSLGFWRGLWAAAVLSIYERTPARGQFILDGIAVSTSTRGRGIGTRLLEEVLKFAKEQGYETVRLDVVDTNPRAKSLYERCGFKAVRNEHFEYLRWCIGFGASTTMEHVLNPNLS